MHKQIYSLIILIVYLRVSILPAQAGDLHTPTRSTLAARSEATSVTQDFAVQTDTLTASGRWTLLSYLEYFIKAHVGRGQAEESPEITRNQFREMLKARGIKGFSQGTVWRELASLEAIGFLNHKENNRRQFEYQVHPDWQELLNKISPERAQELFDSASPNGLTNLEGLKIRPQPSSAARAEEALKILRQRLEAMARFPDRIRSGNLNLGAEFEEPVLALAAEARVHLDALEDLIGKFQGSIFHPVQRPSFFGPERLKMNLYHDLDLQYVGRELINIRAELKKIAEAKPATLDDLWRIIKAFHGMSTTRVSVHLRLAREFEKEERLPHDSNWESWKPISDQLVSLTELASKFLEIHERFIYQEAAKVNVVMSAAEAAEPFTKWANGWGTKRTDWSKIRSVRIRGRSSYLGDNVATLPLLISTLVRSCPKLTRVVVLTGQEEFARLVYPKMEFSRSSQIYQEPFDADIAIDSLSRESFRAGYVYPERLRELLINDGLNVPDEHEPLLPKPETEKSEKYIFVNPHANTNGIYADGLFNSWRDLVVQLLESGKIVQLNQGASREKEALAYTKRLIEEIEKKIVNKDRLQNLKTEEFPDLASFMAAIAHAQAVITIDSSPYHLARVYGVPVVVLTTGTSRGWIPWFENPFFRRLSTDKFLEDPIMAINKLNELLLIQEQKREKEIGAVAAFLASMQSLSLGKPTEADGVWELTLLECVQWLNQLPSEAQVFYNTRMFPGFWQPDTLAAWLLEDLQQDRADPDDKWYVSMDENGHYRLEPGKTEETLDFLLGLADEIASIEAETKMLSAA